MAKKEDQYFEWLEKYKPVTNHIGTHGAYENKMFETFGAELDFVFLKNQQTPENVWTLLEGDEGQYFVAGFHVVNRVGYFITENPWETGTEEYSNDDEVDTSFQIGDRTFSCETAFDLDTDEEFIDVYEIVDNEHKYVGEWLDRSGLPDPDDDEEVEKFKKGLKEFLETKEYSFN